MKDLLAAEATHRPVRILLVGPDTEAFPGEVLRRVEATCVGRLTTWSDFLGVGRDLHIDVVLWLDPPGEEQVWVEGLVQAYRLRPSTGVVLVPDDPARVGPMEATILARRERGQLHHVTAAAKDHVGLVNGIRRVLADLGRPLSPTATPLDVSTLRPSPAAGRPQRMTRPAGGSPRGRVVTVFGAKGGVGKTTLAVGLACLAATAAKRQVLLLDLDTEAADVGVHLDLLDAPDLVDLLPRLDLERARLPLYGGNLFVIPGPARPDLAELVAPDAIESQLRTLPNTFAWVVIDTGARLGDEIAYRAVENADDLLLVLTPDVTSLRTARLLLHHASRLGWHAKKLMVVLNQVYEPPALDVERIAAFLEVPVEHQIPFDRAAVDESILRGEPLVLRRPNHPISRALRRVGASLGMVPADQPPGESGMVDRLRLWWGRGNRLLGRATRTSEGRGSGAR